MGEKSVFSDAELEILRSGRLLYTEEDEPQEPEGEQEAEDDGGEQ